MLSLYVIRENGIRLYVNHNESPDIVLEKHLGESFGEVLSYDWLDMGPLTVYFLHDYNLSPKNLPVINNISESEKFSAILDYFTTTTYIEDQSDPSKLLSVGGNCQAFSLFLRDTFKVNGLEAGLVLQPNHMYNWVVVEGVKYKVDVVDKIVEAM